MLLAEALVKPGRRTIGTAICDGVIASIIAEWKDQGVSAYIKVRGGFSQLIVHPEQARPLVDSTGRFETLVRRQLDPNAVIEFHWVNTKRK